METLYGIYMWSKRKGKERNGMESKETTTQAHQDTIRLTSEAEKERKIVLPNQENWLLFIKRKQKNNF